MTRAQGSLLDGQQARPKVSGRTEGREQSLQGIELLSVVEPPRIGFLADERGSGAATDEDRPRFSVRDEWAGKAFSGLEINFLRSLMHKIGKIGTQPSMIIQRQPFFGPATRTNFLQGGLFSGGSDPLHQPIIDRYRRETGLKPGEASAAMIKYVLAPAYFAFVPRAILNHERHDRPDYASAIVNWPDTSPVWPVLESRSAREEFIRYIVGFDLTNCRPYSQGEHRTAGVCANFARNAETFDNLCQGYASQFYASYTVTGRLPEADRKRLADFGRVYVEQVPAKFHMPIYMATVPGHAFNAILIGSDPRNIDDYLFLEPQTDSLFTAQSQDFRRQVSEGILTIGRLAAFNERGQYIDQTERTFIQEPAGNFVNQPLTPGQIITLTHLLRDFAIAEDKDAWRVNIQQPGITLEALLHRHGQSNSDDNIVFAARFIVGRTFRRSPHDRPETITQDIYLQMLGRQDLAARVRQALSARSPQPSPIQTP
jgi:hypothetical protein